MTADLAEACNDLTQWLPVARTLITEPDITTSTGHVKPGSRPPGNWAVFTLYADVITGIRDIEQELRQTVTGRNQRRQSWSDQATINAIDAVAKLAQAAPEHDVTSAARTISSWITTFLQLPAVDIEERPQRVRSACPYCEFGMLSLRPRSGEITCLRHGVCFDSAGEHPRGELVAYSDGSAAISWKDGKVT